MMRRLWALSVITWAACVNPCPADDEYLQYDVPANAQREGPRGTRDGGTLYKYFDATHHLISNQIEWDGVVIEKQLFLQGEVHGIQRKWWPKTGYPQEESPYRSGKMHGLFKRWDEAGRLVAQYQMSDGEGTAIEYHSTGRMKYLSDYHNGKRSDRDFIFYDNGQAGHVGWCANGAQVGWSFSFHRNGQPEIILYNDGRHGTVGPIVEYRDDGQLQSIIYRVKERDVDPEAYRQLTLHDASLPVFFSDPMQYKTLINAEVMGVVEEYRAKAPVKIPLQFDQSGSPLPR